MRNVILVALLAWASPALAASITAGQDVTSVSAGSIQPAGPGRYSGNLSNEAGLAYSTTYLLDMNQYGATGISAQAFYTSTTFPSPTVSDGQKSTGSFTVLSNTSLSSATATINITVSNNFFGATLPTLTFGNCNLKMGRDYARGATSAASATNLAAAITACNSRINTSASAGIVYATATYGSYANSYAFTSDNGSVTVSAAIMSGGRDNAAISINGVSLTRATDWNIGASSVATAANIVTAINANSSLSSVVVATSNANTGPAYGVVNVTSILNGTAYNYALTTSSPTALSVFRANMFGGADSGFTLGSAKIKAAASTLTVGLPVLWAIGSNPAIGGLTTGTTYYAVPAGGTSFYLSRCSSCAVAGSAADFVTLTSTTSSTAASTYTIAPLAISGTPSFKWQVSNDNSNWDDLNVSSVTVSSYSIPPAVTSWAFGTLGYRYIRQNVVGPTTGGLYLKTVVQLNR